MGLVTYGTTFTANATNHIYFRVPHGCPDVDAATHGGFNARTTKVEVNIPAAVTGVKPEQKPGWDVAVTRDPVTNCRHPDRVDGPGTGGLPRRLDLRRLRCARPRSTAPPAT